MTEHEKFSLRSRRRSFYYAGRGLWRFFRSEHNAWIHLGATIVVITAAAIFRIPGPEAAVLALAIGLVWVAEIINTCLEKAMDLISRERHPQIGFIKDLAAGAVLVASIAALVTGALIFAPYILKMLALTPNP
jgi:diacylglycerol kinase (ATP)